MAISKIKSDSIDTIAATKLTGTVDNARITLDAAEIPNLDAAKITTGDISNARVPASAVTQHVTATDMTPIENDLAILALQNAVNSNMTAHSLQNNWIEQFEDSNSITGLTNCSRVTSGEYVASVYSVNGAFTSDANTLLLLHMDDAGLTDSSSHGHAMALNADVARSSTQSKYGGYSAVFDGSSDQIRPADNAMWDFGTGDYTIETWIWINTLVNNGAIWDTGAWANNNFDMVIRYNANAQWQIGIYNGSSDRYLTDTTSPGLTTNRWYHLAVSRASGVTRLHRDGVLISAVAQQSWVGNENITSDQPRIGANNWTSHNGYLDEMRVSNIARYGASNFTPNETASSNATGSFTSTTITPQDSASKSSLGLVLLYKNNAGTNTLNTDVICKVSADNGSNYSTCVLASKGTFSTGINIAIAPAIAVTAGTQLKYKVEFANQASGSKEAQIHGVALQY
ncbi:LamG domain-containing protein [bacterium]|nr:LamG domain-containing protein [bacterium]